MIRGPLAVLAAAALLAACGSGGTRVDGIVVEVDGDLNVVRDFTIVTPDGGRLTFVPVPDLRFESGSPLSHLGEHVRSGDPVEVTYEELADGTLSATRVEDVPLPR